MLKFVWNIKNFGFLEKHCAGICKPKLFFTSEEILFYFLMYRLLCEKKIENINNALHFFFVIFQVLNNVTLRKVLIMYNNTQIEIRKILEMSGWFATAENMAICL